MKREISKASVERAIAAGARNMTDIAHAHGYKGNVSGDVTKVIRKLVPKVGEILADVKAGKAFKPAPAVVVEQRKAPYHGPVYSKVFNVAVRIGATEGAKPRVELVARIVKETHLGESQVDHALQVMRTPRHQSNRSNDFPNGRSDNVAGERGQVLLVPLVPVEG